jgi:hypothetical protein
MNDTELDELLEVWTVPSPRPLLRERLQAEIEAKRPRPPRRLFTRWRLVTAAAILMLAVLLVSTDASSSSPPAYTIDSEITHQEGALRWTEWPKRILMTSYSDAGREVILSWSFPDHPLDTAYIKMLILAEERSETLKRRFNRIVRSYYAWKYELKTSIDSDPDAVAYLTDPDDRFYLGGRTSLLSSGCRTSHATAEVIGHDVVLNYATTVVQMQQDASGADSNRKTTIWMAPELSCAVLRSTSEIRQRGGWGVVTERKALKITANR